MDIKVSLPVEVWYVTGRWSVYLLGMSQDYVS